MVFRINSGEDEVTGNALGKYSDVEGVSIPYVLGDVLLIFSAFDHRIEAA